MDAPADCRTKQHSATRSTASDRELIALLAERFGYVRRMAEIKQDPGRGPYPATGRRSARQGRCRGGGGRLDGKLIREMWRSLIEWNVDYVRRTIAARKQGSSGP
jgi:isochorismate pyruvate lyase